MNKFSIEILATGKKYVLIAPLHIGRQHDCSIYLDNPVLGENTITVEADDHGDPVVFGPSGKRLRPEAINSFGLSVKKYKRLKLTDIFQSRILKLTGIFLVFIIALYQGFKKESAAISHSTMLSLKVDEENSISFGKHMDNLRVSTDLLIVDFSTNRNDLYLEYLYSDLDIEKELEIFLGEQRIYFNNGFKPCFFKQCQTVIDLSQYLHNIGLHRLRFIHNNPSSSYKVSDITIKTKSNADSRQLSQFKNELDRSIRLYKDSSVSSSNIVEAMEIIFVMEQELLKINVEKNLTKNLEAIKRQLIDEHMKRVEALEFSISKNLRLSRYEEAKVGLTELLALALKHEYSRKQWINKNLLTVDKLMKEKRHGI